MKRKLDNLKNNPELQDKLQQLKPKRNIWGVLGVILLFFVPEIVNAIWYKEIKEWIFNQIGSSPQTPMSEPLKWATDQVFTGEISYLNIGLGIAFLVWIFWDDIKKN